MNTLTIIGLVAAIPVVYGVALEFRMRRKHRRRMREIAAVNELRKRAAWERRNGNTYEAAVYLGEAMTRLEGIRNAVLNDLRK